MPPPLQLPPILPPWLSGGAPPVPRPTMPPPPQSIGPAPPGPTDAPPGPTPDGAPAPVQVEPTEDPLVSIVRALLEGAVLEDQDGNPVADFSILPPELRDAIKQVLVNFAPSDTETPSEDATEPTEEPAAQ